MSWRPRSMPSAGSFRESLMGTVGAVALDAAGNLAAATSTGGMTAKRWGRVGDSPVIGAGTYAANDCCAVSATGHGEYFIRATVAHEIASLIRYAGKSVREAADIVVHEQLRRMGGEGGVIVVGRDGTIAMPFNSRGMLRGSIDAQGRMTTGILSTHPAPFTPKPEIAGEIFVEGNRVRRLDRACCSIDSAASAANSAPAWTSSGTAGP